ncbi:MAG: PstS family phosphate ABC transporter substrate-binding protein [Bacteroidales bacterium]
MLLEIPIAIDAFIMIVNNSNPVNNLTTKQIQDIYTGEITNWVEVGGKAGIINPYIRNSTSGSQVLMESLIMKDLAMTDLPALDMSSTMWGPFQILSNDNNGICYTVYYYHEFMARAEGVKSIAVDGVHPEFSTLQKREYPYTTDVYVMIRKDLDKSSMAYKLFNLLLSGAGRKVIEESGYVPY